MEKVNAEIWGLNQALSTGWAFPEAIFPHRPDIQAFLRGLDRIMTIDGFVNIHEARQYKATTFWCQEQGCSFMVEEEGTGRRSRLLIVKTDRCANRLREKRDKLVRAARDALQIIHIEQENLLVPGGGMHELATPEFGGSRQMGMPSTSPNIGYTVTPTVRAAEYMDAEGVLSKRQRTA